MSEPIDPVCAFHGLKQSEHDCLYCCLCFETMTPEECWVDKNGQKWDIHPECKEADDLAYRMNQQEQDDLSRFGDEGGN